MNIDANAPIEPYIGIGGIKLYSTMDELNNVLSLPETKKMKIAKYWVRYDIGNLVTLFFHTKNKKVRHSRTNLRSLPAGIIEIIIV